MTVKELFTTRVANENRINQTFALEHDVTPSPNCASAPTDIIVPSLQIKHLVCTECNYLQ